MDKIYVKIFESGILTREELEELCRLMERDKELKTIKVFRRGDLLINSRQDGKKTIYEVKSTNTVGLYTLLNCDNEERENINQEEVERNFTKIN